VVADFCTTPFFLDFYFLFFFSFFLFLLTDFMQMKNNLARRSICLRAPPLIKRPDLTRKERKSELKQNWVYPGMN
jgi:hypothetical protein